MEYKPTPLDTSSVQLDEEVRLLIEKLAENTHDVWAIQRMRDGWRWGPRRQDASKEHPCLVPYEQLPESEKEYDRQTAMQTLKAILTLGYRIEKTS